MHVRTQEDETYPSRWSKQESRDHNETLQLLFFYFGGNLVVLQIFCFFKKCFSNLGSILFRLSTWIPV